LTSQMSFATIAANKNAKGGRPEYSFGLPLRGCNAFAKKGEKQWAAS
jgi:hypothetical protein